MKMNLNTRIMSHSKTILSKKEKEIDDFFEANPHLIIALPIGELAQKMKIGTSNISRYVRKIGFKKFVDFRYYFAKRIEFLAQNQKIIKNQFESIIINNANFMSYALKETASRISIKQLEATYQLIINADMTLCYGFGSSNLAASEIATQLMEHGINSTYYRDFHHMKQVLQSLARYYQKKITLLLFSRSLAGNEVERIFNIVNEASNIKIVTICSCKAIKKYKVDINLEYQILETHSHYEVSSKIGQIYISSLIFHYILFKDHKI